MTSFVPPKRKLIELLVMLILAGVLYLMYPNMDAVVLFLFGFIWNWSASNDLTFYFTNRRNRMSMLRLVVNLQNLILKPFNWAPEIIKRMMKVFPAGVFWFLVIFINESDMPWWPTFLGSIAFELLQIEFDIFKRHKEVS